MKLLITRLRIPRPAENKGRPSRRRHKVLTVLLGTALTLGVCLAAENIPRRKAVPASVPAPEGKALPVICYSQVLTDGAAGGKRTVSADMLRQDLAWLADHRCETVSCSDVIGFARGLEQLPEKPVLLLFDGSWETILTAVLPLLEEQSAKAAAVICGSDAELYSAQVPKKEEDARLSWNEIRLLDQSPLVELVSGKAREVYARKEQEIGAPLMRELERVIMLRVVDEYWMDQIDAMNELKQGIGLRAYAQTDPVVAYKQEGYEMFENMIAAIQEETIRRIYLARVQVGGAVKRERVAKVTGESGGSDQTVKKQPVKKQGKIGRNDPCPCGSGKKWKKCDCAEYHGPEYQ